MLGVEPCHLQASFSEHRNWGWGAGEEGVQLQSDRGWILGMVENVSMGPRVGAFGEIPLVSSKERVCTR